MEETKGTATAAAATPPAAPQVIIQVRREGSAPFGIEKDSPSVISDFSPSIGPLGCTVDIARSGFVALR
jgi:hypothetical protein